MEELRVNSNMYHYKLCLQKMLRLWQMIMTSFKNQNTSYTNAFSQLCKNL